MTRRHPGGAGGTGRGSSRPGWVFAARSVLPNRPATLSSPLCRLVTDRILPVYGRGVTSGGGAHGSACACNGASVCAALAAPGWHCWRGVNGRLYARRPGSSPQVEARAGDALSLRVTLALMDARRQASGSYWHFPEPGRGGSGRARPAAPGSPARHAAASPPRAGAAGPVAPCYTVQTGIAALAGWLARTVLLDHAGRLLPGHVADGGGGVLELDETAMDSLRGRRVQAVGGMEVLTDGRDRWPVLGPLGPRKDSQG